MSVDRSPLRKDSRLSVHACECSKCALSSFPFRVDDLSSDMCLQGLAVQSLHGDREQYDREEALQDFKESMSQGGKSPVKSFFVWVFR